MHNLFSRFVEKSWQFKMIESFIIVLYDCVNIHGNLNEARREMSYEKSWNPEKIPSTQCTLHPHVMKAFLPLRQNHYMAKVKSILLVISMRHLQIMEHYFLYRYFCFMPLHELKTPLHFLKILLICMGSVEMFSYKHRIISLGNG